MKPPDEKGSGIVSAKFRAAMQRAGLDYAGPMLADGRLHRFKPQGDRERNGWYVLHSGQPAAGVFGCWKRGIKETWHERNGALSQGGWDKIRRQWREAEAERGRAENDRHTNARKVAARILRQVKPATAHTYLDRKNARAFGELRQWKDALVVPLRDAAGELHSLQFIAGGAGQNSSATPPTPSSHYGQRGR